MLYPNDATYEGKELRLRQQLLGCKRNAKTRKKVGNKWEDFKHRFRKHIVDYKLGVIFDEFRQPCYFRVFVLTTLNLQT